MTSQPEEKYSFTIHEIVKIMYNAGASQPLMEREILGLMNLNSLYPPDAEYVQEIIKEAI